MIKTKRRLTVNNPWIVERFRLVGRTRDHQPGRLFELVFMSMIGS
jgi:hypothetical protein